MKPERVTPTQRQAVLARARGRCEYCHTPDGFVPGSFAVEHIVPRSRGGRTRLDNLALSYLDIAFILPPLLIGIDPDVAGRVEGT